MGTNVGMCMVGGVILWVNHLKQPHTDDLPLLLLCMSSGCLVGLSVTGWLSSTNWFIHTEVGCLPREEVLAFGTQYLTFAVLLLIVSVHTHYKRGL